MSSDPYTILGVSRTATDDEIKKAYHALARKYHPDRNPGDKQAEAKFKEIQNAYEILSDKAKRAHYDRYGASGPQGGFGGFGADADVLQDLLRNFGGFGFGGGSIDPDTLQDLLRGQAAAGARGRGHRGGRRAPVQDVEHDLSVPFDLASRGGKLDLRMNGNVIGVTIPAGAKEGQVLRLRGILPDGGNLKLRLHIEPHPFFRRDGDDLLIDVPLSLTEAVLGAKVEIPTPSGSRVTITIPPGSSSGARLRLRGLGISGGDLYAVVKIVVPKQLDDRSRELMGEWAKLHPHDVRADAPWNR
jgi:DnaJ-class molecular chaperone